MSTQDFQGRRVWITGASSGIGRAVALELAGRGARVILSGRNRAALEQAAGKCGAGAIPLPLDVTDRAANLQAAAAIRERAGGLDIAVLNAGTCEYVEARRFDSGVFERVMQSNFLGMVYGIEAVLPLLRQSSSPHLVGMSSTVAYGGLPRTEAYGASKAAIRYMLASLRIDLLPERIPVSVVCPGFVRTPLTDQNDFPMPFRIEAEAAARCIADGIAARRHEIHFPKRFSLPFKLLALLPSGLYTRLVGRMTRTS